MSKENNRRIYPGESNKYKPHEAAKRRQEASQRQLKSDELTPQQKIDKLDLRFGKGLGAVKERKRLALLISAPQANNSTIEAVETVTISDEVMAEIEAMNEESSSKKKTKAKERRSKHSKNN